MEPKKAIQIIEDCLENNWLNLHEGQYDDEADEFEKAQKLTKVISLEQYEDWVTMGLDMYLSGRKHKASNCQHRDTGRGVCAECGTFLGS